MNNSIDVPHNSILRGSIFKAISETSAPILVMYLLSSFIGLSDMFYAGHIGDAAQAAIGIGEQVIFLSTLVATGLCAGMVACVSRYIGAGQIELARLYARDGLWLAALFGLLGTVGGVMIAQPIFSLFGSDPQVYRQGVPYLQTCALANVPWVLALCQSAIFRAVGLPKYSLYAWMVISSISVIGGGILFFAPLSPLRFSLSAMSASWIIGSTAGVLLGFYWLPNCWPKLSIISDQAVEQPQADGLVEMLKRSHDLLWIAGPAALSDVIFIGSNFALYKLFSIMPHSADVQAAWSVSLKLEETFATMPILALSLAAAAIVGQNLGAGQNERARQAGWKVAGISAGAMILVGLLLCVFSNQLASTLSATTLVHDYTSMFLKTAPIMLPALALSMVLFGALEGAGCTWIPMAGYLSSIVLVRLLFAWLLAIPAAMGLIGVLVALAISRVYICILAVVVFSRVKLEEIGLASGLIS